MALRLNSVFSSASVVSPNNCLRKATFNLRRGGATIRIRMALSETPSTFKVIDSHLHVWASSQEAGKFPYSPGQEPNLPGHVDFLLQCMEEAGVDGALIVQPINHKFDHSYVTSVLKKYPAKFFGCCLANPADDGSGLKQLEHLVLKDGYRAVRFNPYLWPSGEKMTNEIGKAIFKRAGELHVPVNFMCMKVYVKFSALFRVSRTQFPYLDLSPLLSQVVSSFGANRVIWGSDFPFVVPECGYKGAKDAVQLIAHQISLPSSDLEWIMGRTATQLFQSHLITAKQD
ncbi:uncharacterized protein [Cicer arietinum]|uniref:Uncharacterized protein LOC101498693 isoform X2 n=1 Tax=Cicer arietinum TaxID=3827 RepID=A0A3Q7XXL6_CICAR|nr:uncharacterized protein LOC101498693 isoform X2 [Cicer arietinum]